ncbi:hypothetical protein CCHR01_05268 [Colletotrichum chrysophilum]|uniref:Uncharacterized protein n=1 Tax=Colletotrichum chrysophilum TaxID=1836956 RepID=A0AAD9APP2_9PEZI|nr:hypothetical protein CCHR01_05268 [Colletotrichum chrysophilum]
MTDRTDRSLGDSNHRSWMSVNPMSMRSQMAGKHVTSV